VRLKSELMIPAVILTIIAVVVGFLNIGGDLLGMDSDDIDTTTILVLGAVPIFITFFVVYISSGYMLAGAFAGMGLSVAFLLHLMEETSLIVDEPTLPISVIQVFVILVFVILAFGAVVKER